MPPKAIWRWMLTALASSALSSGLPAAEEASTPPVPAKLSVREAVRISLKNNPSLKQTAVSYLASKSGLASASDLTTTTVFAGLSEASAGGGSSQSSGNLGGQFSWLRRAGDSLSATVVPASTNDMTSNLQLQYRRPLVSQSGRTSTTNQQVAAAEFDLASSENTLYMARQSTSEDTIRAYFSAVRARDLIRVSEQDVATATETVRAARRKLEEGLVAEIEVSQAEIQLAQSQDALVSQKRASRDAVDALLLAMGLKVGQDPELVDTAEVERIKLDPDKLVAEAVSSRKDLNVLDIGIQQQKLNLDVAADLLRPTLDLQGTYTKAGFGVGSNSSYSSDSNWTAGLEYSMPIGNIPRRERRAVAERALHQLSVDKDFRTQQIKNEVLAGVRRVEAAAATIDIYSANMKVAEANLNLAQRMVAEGLRLNRDLLDAQVALTRTRSSLLSAQIDYYLALIALDKALGRDLAQEMAG